MSEKISLKQTIYEVVTVTWEDAMFISQDQTEEELRLGELPVLFSVGFLVENTSDRITIALEVDDRVDPKTFRHIQSIPKRMVLKIESVSKVDSNPKEK